MDGQEDDLFKIFPLVAWLSIRGLPLHQWNKANLAKLVIKFAHLIAVDESTVKKINLETAEVKIGSDNKQLSPKEFHAMIDSQLCRIKIDVHCKMITPRDPFLKTSLTDQVSVIWANGRGGDLEGKSPAGQVQ